jgi:TetR/AcrR family transcriptional regulator
MPDALQPDDVDLDTATRADSTASPAPRKRPKPGERRIQILQTLAAMLEQPGGERVTTSALAARLEVSEAALYRHFASKAQMFEGLIEFIEHSVFSLINQITEKEFAPVAGASSEQSVAQDGANKVAKIVLMLLQFAEKNPGMARVMVGDALVFENDRLQQRMNLFFDKVESALKQALRGWPSQEALVVSAVAAAFAAGRLQRFVRSGFKRLPTDHLDASLARILG